MSDILLNFCFVFLQIGLAVGDIDSIQQNAEYKRLSVKVMAVLGGRGVVRPLYEKVVNARHNN